MAEVVGVKLQIESNAGEAVGSLRKQLKEAQAEVQALSEKFGATSEQAVSAAKKAADLRDRIGDAKALTDAFNPDRKFQAFASALQGVVGGFSAVQGALGLVGVESEDVQKTLLKVQSAMALSQGINSVLEARDSFKNLGAVIQSTTIFQKANNIATTAAIALQRLFGVATVQTSVAFRVLKGAIAATGIGLLLVGVTALIGKIQDWTASTNTSKAAQDRLNAALEQQERLFAQQQKSLGQAREIALKRAQIAGASADELFNINQDFNKKDREAAVNNAKTISAELQKFRNQRLEATKDGRLRGSEEDIKYYNEQRKNLEKANEQIRDIDFKSQSESLDNQVRISEERRQKAKESSDKASQEAKQRREKAKQEAQQEAEERLQAEKELTQRLRDLENENFANSIKDETQRALVRLSQQKEKDQLEIQQSKATAETKAKLLAQLDEQFRLEKNQIETEAANKRKEQEAADAKEAQEKLTERINLENQIRIAGIQDEFERKRAELQSQQEQEEAELANKRAENYFSEEVYQQGLLNIKNKYVQAETELKKKQAEDEAKIREARRTAELELYDTIGQGLGALGGLFGQGTAASKAFALSEIAINSATGFARGLSIAQQSAAGTGPGAAFAFPIFYAQQALAVVNIIAKARNILKTVKGGGGSSASVSAPSVSGGGSAPIAPASPEAALTQLDQGTINRLGSATSRAYVVESDITNSQERIRRINRAARLN